ncbi:MAG: CIA30 family protein [Firmicutes bacterium]|nr:CIA30 family protein [Bacillota bacterium]
MSQDEKNMEKSGKNEKNNPNAGGGESANYKSGRVKLHRREDPLFGRHNMVLVVITIVLTVVLIYFFRFAPGVSNQKTIVFEFPSSAGAFMPIAGGGKSEGKITAPSGIPGATGKACLQYDYENEVDQFFGVVTIKPDMKNFENIKFRIKSKTDRTFAVSVQEISGVVYMHIFQLKADQWQDVSITPADFSPSADAHDANGKLDCDQLNSKLVIADMSGDKGIIGPNTFWIDRIEIDK